MHKRFHARAKALISSAKFASYYAVGAVVVLIVTTLFWALKSANLQLGNADHLVDPFLFQNAATFHGATFPGQHTLLLKWPLFWLIKLFGYSPPVFTAFTVAITLVTVAGLAAIMYLIERRLLLFGTLCLSLASTLMLVPAVPYAGANLPVNMAMLETRNLEYLLFVGCLALLIKSSGLTSRWFWLAAAGLSLLVASDKLFLTISVGGAVLALVFYGVARVRRFQALSLSWLTLGVFGAFGGFGILELLGFGRLTHISSQGGIGPYGLVHSLHGLVLGSVYSVLELLTNFGANPAFDVSVIKHIPHQAFLRLAAPSGLAFAVNILFVGGGVVVIWRLLAATVSRKQARPNQSILISALLAWSSLAALLAFIVSDHYYPVDARYLTIAVFALFVAMATYTSQRRWQNSRVVATGVIIVLGILLALPTVNGVYNKDRAVTNDISDRNLLVASALAKHPVQLLVGDYWRVMPIKAMTGGDLVAMPLLTCSVKQQILSSQAWRPSLSGHRFAYLLSAGRSGTGYMNCTLDQVIGLYGRPNASVLIAGTASHPVEQVLFYDHGAHHDTYSYKTEIPSAVLPIGIGQAPYTTCDRPTVVQVVAHQDDDLLFMSPDLLHSIMTGDCVRTIYVTAGDAGIGKLYWLGREQGAEAAYSQMTAENDNIWVERIVRLANNSYVTIATPTTNYKVSLIFMHLPDGNLRGQGFKVDGNESLARLAANRISVMHSVDRQSFYTSDQLTGTLVALMSVYKPAEIRTLANYPGYNYPDHSDHITTSFYAKRAYRRYLSQLAANQTVPPIEFYVGYPVRGRPPNVFDPDLQQKEAAFLTYARSDGAVCNSVRDCSTNPVFKAYLSRQYQNPY